MIDLSYVADDVVIVELQWFWQMVCFPRLRIAEDNGGEQHQHRGHGCMFWLRQCHPKCQCICLPLQCYTDSQSQFCIGTSSSLDFSQLAPFGTSLIPLDFHEAHATWCHVMPRDATSMSRDATWCHVPGSESNGLSLGPFLRHSFESAVDSSSPQLEQLRLELPRVDAERRRWSCQRHAHRHGGEGQREEREGRVKVYKSVTLTWTWLFLNTFSSYHFKQLQYVYIHL